MNSVGHPATGGRGGTEQDGPGAPGTARGSAAEGGRDQVPAAERCIWPGCTRPRAPGRASGSGRQKEYCLQADPPERGGGPAHNARNRWAALRAGAPPSGGAALPGGAAGDGSGREPGEPAAGREPGHGAIRDTEPFTGAKRRAGELLDQARQQHAAALAGLRAELELYQRAGQELAGLADPEALDLEIATIAARAGRHVAQAEQDAADARRAQLAAQRESGEAIRLRKAAEQLAEDAAEAERLLAGRTAAFERDLADLAGRAQAAEAARRAALEEAAEAKAEAAAARDRAEQAAAALADALRDAAAAREQAREEAAAARSRADELVAAARRDAALAVAGAREQAAREQALLAERASAARAEADQARADAAQARASADRARDETGAARAEAAAAGARAEAVAAELERARGEFARSREAHAAELTRLTAAHDAVLGAERARADRAEADLRASRAGDGAAPAAHGGES